MRCLRIGWLLMLAALAPVTAHVGSPDVFFDGMAGPYPLLIVIRPPLVIPGTAQVEVRTSTPGVRTVKFLPMPLTGPGSKSPPTADVAAQSAVDPNLYTGQLWLMALGSWQVKVSVDGAQGSGVVSVPVPALPTQSRGMDKTLASLLFGLTVFLVVGLVSIVGAAVRESTLAVGAQSPSAFRPKSLIVMVATSALLIAALYGGSQWWGSEAANYSRKLYRPLDLHATVQKGNVLALQLTDPGWLQLRKLDDLVLDHDHLMHLYAIRQPDLNVVFHLHPEQIHPGAFELPLPPMPPGRYKLFADIVHQAGLGETMVSELTIANSEGTPLSGDNSGGMVSAGATISPLPDGTRMVWVRRKEPVRAGSVQRFVFRIEDSAGKPLSDLEPYMAMAGHAAFVKSDLSTFAHVHPVGSAPMSAVMLAASENAPDSMTTMHEMPLGAEVSFPYAFPTPGRYRIFVQMKRAGAIQTGAFDLDVL
jgi:hypothetical protein